MVLYGPHKELGDPSGLGKPLRGYPRCGATLGMRVALGWEHGCLRRSKLRPAAFSI